MSENIQSIANGSFVLGSTSATTYQAGPGISITQPSEGIVRISNDETVLWNNGNSFTITVPESIYNFEKLSVTVHRQGTLVPNQEFYTDRISAVGGHFYTNYIASETVNNNSMYFFTTPYNVSEDGKTITSPVSSMGIIFDLNGTNIFRYKNNSTAPIFRIVGINRIGGSNT
jgi:hypothetical protein